MQLPMDCFDPVGYAVVNCKLPLQYDYSYCHQIPVKHKNWGLTVLDLLDLE